MITRNLWGHRVEWYFLHLCSRPPPLLSVQGHPSGNFPSSQSLFLLSCLIPITTQPHYYSTHVNKKPVKYISLTPLLCSCRKVATLPNFLLSLLNPAFTPVFHCDCSCQGHPLASRGSIQCLSFLTSGAFDTPSPLQLWGTPFSTWFPDTTPPSHLIRGLLVISLSPFSPVP